MCIRDRLRWVPWICNAAIRYTRTVYMLRNNNLRPLVVELNSYKKNTNNNNDNNSSKEEKIPIFGSCLTFATSLYAYALIPIMKTKSKTILLLSNPQLINLFKMLYNTQIHTF